jgi:hypothetical protein
MLDLGRDLTAVKRVGEDAGQQLDAGDQALRP